MTNGQAISDDGALAALAFIFDRQPPRTLSRDLSPGTDEAFFMLQAFVYDLARKCLYTFKALRGILDRDAEELPADLRELARQIREHNAAVDGTGSWQECAEVLDGILDGLHAGEGLRDDHDALLDRAAGD